MPPKRHRKRAGGNEYWRRPPPQPPVDQIDVDLDDDGGGEEPTICERPIVDQVPLPAAPGPATDGAPNGAEVVEDDEEPVYQPPPRSNPRGMRFNRPRPVDEYLLGNEFMDPDQVRPSRVPSTKCQRKEFDEDLVRPHGRNQPTYDQTMRQQQDPTAAEPAFPWALDTHPTQDDPNANVVPGLHGQDPDQTQRLDQLPTHFYQPPITHAQLRNLDDEFDEVDHNLYNDVPVRHEFRRPDVILQNLMSQRAESIASGSDSSSSRRAVAGAIPGATRSKAWTFTYFPPEDEILRPPFTEGTLPVGMQYVCFQLERTTRNGKIHWQGYLELESRQTLRAVARMFPLQDRVHLEPRRGPQQQAIEYTKKDATAVDGPFRWIEIGIPGVENPVNTWVAISEAIKTGATMLDIFSRWPGEAIRCQAAIQKLIGMVSKSPEWREVKVFVFWGATGTGKTRRAFDEARRSNKEIFKKMNGKWFDGYTDEPWLIIDEFMGDQGNYHDEEGMREMLNWLDGHPLRVPVKGGSVSAMWTRVYVTSNKKPSEWFPKASPEHKAALARRINHSVYFPAPHDAAE
jgi:Putative viral replication protein/RNA helicase